MHNPTKSVGFFVALGSKNDFKNLYLQINFISLLLFLDFYGLCGILSV